MELDLPIYFYTDFSEIVDSNNLDEAVVRVVTFFEISSVRRYEYTDKSKHYTVIVSGGVEYVCQESVEQVKAMVRRATRVPVMFN